jgi:hypothetical protein
VRKGKDGETTLHFASFDCTIADISVFGGRVVDFLPLPDERGALVEDANSTVFAVSPWREETVELGLRVLASDHPFRYSLLVKDGQLVLYDVFAEPLVTVGSDVVGALFLPDAGQLLLADATGGVAAVPIEANDVPTVWLSDDGCELIDSGPTARVAAFYSPCAARRLVLYRPANGDDPGAAVRLAMNAEAPRIVTRSLALQSGVEAEVMSAVFFRSLDADGSRGELWAQSAGEPPYQLLDSALDSWMLPAFDARKGEHRVVALALVPGGGADAVDLVAADGDVQVPIARRVISLFESTRSLTVIAEGDGTTGDLIVLESRPFEDVVLREPELLLSNALAGIELHRSVVLRNVVGIGRVRLDQDQERLALVRTGPGSDEALFLVRQSLLNGSFAEPQQLTVGAGELYSFSQNVPDTALSLVRSDPDSFRLEQLWYEQEARATIGRNVAHFYESVAPGRLGVVYATAGDAAGLYYSSLR